VKVIDIPSFHDEESGSIGVEDLGRAPALGPVPAVGPFEVVEAEPGGEVGIDVGGRGGEAGPDAVL
jgi:hypothetical protein